MDFFSQINSDPSMIRCADMESLSIKDGYSIVPIVHPTWKSAEQRLLVIVESIDSLDLFHRDLLTGTTVDHGIPRGEERTNHNPMRSVLSNILDLAVAHLKPYGINPGEFSLGVANFNAKRIKQLEPSRQAAAFPSFTARVTEIIRRLKPTHVLVCGDTASHFLLESLEAGGDSPPLHEPTLAAENSLYKRGWVFKRKLGKHQFLLTPTIDLESIYNPSKKQMEEEDESDDKGDSDRYAAADLLFFITRNIANLLNGAMLHDLSHIKPNAVYVDTIEKFDAFYAKLLEAPMCSTDTETRNLSNFHNDLYVAQFALSTKRAYVIPVLHPKTPFTPEESQYILKKLRKYLLSKRKRIIATLNGTFDLRIYRTQMNMEVIPYHQIHEVTAGEQLLDENIGLFARLKFYFAGNYVKTSYQNLRNLFCLYGNDWYYRAAFSKEERSLVGLREPDDPDVLDYCAMDAQSTLAVALEQLKIAENQVIKPSLAAKKVRYSQYFTTHLLNQMSNTVQSISHMEQTGSPLDIDYLKSLLAKDSPLHKLLKETGAELAKMPTVIKASRLVLERSGKATTSLFGDDISMDVFDVGKKEHKELLLFDVMRLKVIGYTKTKQRAIDKAFMAVYRDKHAEVAALEVISKTKHMMSTYIKSWILLMQNNLDSVHDFALRAAFGFFTIVTGRLNSFKPSLQQVPNHGKLAYYIKRAFVPPLGCLNVKFDYSAHEVRCWSILSGDKALANSFQQGLNLRRDLIQAASIPAPAKGWKDVTVEMIVEELSTVDASTIKGKAKRLVLKAQIKLMKIRSDLKKKGDSHIQNVFLFFGIWIEKSDPMREAIKKIVFGLIYGKGLRTLARDIDKTPEETQEIVDKLFTSFPDGAAWLDASVEQVTKYGHVVSPIGRVRRLWRVYTGKKGVIAAAGRRAQNSPIQGFASEIGATAAFLIIRTCYEFIKEQGLDMETHMPKLCRAVHDASYFVVPFPFVLPFIHICQYVATNGVTDWYKEVFGFGFTIEPEIELEVAASDDKSHKWNWSLPQLLGILYKTTEELVSVNRLKESDVQSTFDSIIEPWVDEEYQSLLQRQFPLLNVKNLDVQIQEALKLFKSSKSDCLAEV